MSNRRKFPQWVPPAEVDALRAYQAMLKPGAREVNLRPNEAPDSPKVLHRGLLQSPSASNRPLSELQKLDADLVEGLERLLEHKDMKGAWQALAKRNHGRDTPFCLVSASAQALCTLNNRRFLRGTFDPPPAISANTLRELARECRRLARKFRSVPQQPYLLVEGWNPDEEGSSVFERTCLRAKDHQDPFARLYAVADIADLAAEWCRDEAPRVRRARPVVRQRGSRHREVIFLARLLSQSFQSAFGKRLIDHAIIAAGALLNREVDPDTLRHSVRKISGPFDPLA